MLERELIWNRQAQSFVTGQTIQDAYRLRDHLNSITTDLTFTTETIDDFAEGWLPPLDTQLKFENRTYEQGQYRKINYKFYSKPSASKFSILSLLAMNQAIKSNTLAQEYIRRLKNTSTEVPVTKR